MTYVFRRFVFFFCTLLLVQTGHLLAQDLRGLTLCIDPGHGQGNVNAGPTGLREADINLQVSLFWRDFLQAAHIDTVLLTRTSDATNPTLSQREQLANSFGVAWFHSVHHNASGLPTNTTFRYTLMLYEEVTRGQPQWPGQSEVMSRLMGNRIWQALRTSDWRVFGDLSFYNPPFNLGVLNDLQMPGELSEGTFHDNAVEEAKMRNADFLHLEARGLYTAFLEYFSAGALPTGAVSGIVTGADTGQRLDGATVTLLPDGTPYTTDTWHNGLFVFHDLPPGQYAVQAAAAGYDTLTRNFTVAANTFLGVDLTLTPDISPRVTASAPQNGANATNVHNLINIKFSASMDEETVRQAFHLIPEVAGTLSARTPPTIFTFEPEFRLEFGTSYILQIDSTAHDIYGHKLDGNGDGAGGDSYRLYFRTTPLDTTFPQIVDYTPHKQTAEVFLRTIFNVRFSRRLDPASVRDNSTVFARDALGLRTPLRFVHTPLAEGEVLSLIPAVPLTASSTYFVNLTASVADTSGARLPGSFQWSFFTENNTDLWQTVTTFARIDSGFIDPRLAPETSGLIADSLVLRPTTTAVSSDSTALAVRLVFSDTTGRAMLRFVNPDVPVDATDAAALAVRGDSSGARLAFVFRDPLGVAYERRFAVDWYGWQTLAFITARDSLQRADGQRQLLQTRLAWEGVLVRAPNGRVANLEFDDAYLRKPEATVGVDAAPGLPKSFVTLQTYPNPVNAKDGRTHIVFVLAKPGRVRLTVYDLLGREVANVFDTAVAAGRHETTWAGTDNRGRRVQPGVYFVRWQTGTLRGVQKILILP